MTDADLPMGRVIAGLRYAFTDRAGVRAAARVRTMLGRDSRQEVEKSRLDQHYRGSVSPANVTTTGSNFEAIA